VIALSGSNSAMSTISVRSSGGGAVSAAKKERDRGDERQKRTDERRYVESVALSQCALGRDDRKEQEKRTPGSIR
jgi:hypothetical protein